LLLPGNFFAQYRYCYPLSLEARLMPSFVSALPSFLLTTFIVLSVAGCGQQSEASGHDNHAMAATVDDDTTTVKDDRKYPPAAEHAAARLQASPRHGEYAMISVPGKRDSLRAWVSYPERATKAPVVIVIHEIFGLTTWVRAVADQLAAEGFIAIAPDLLSFKKLPGSADSAAYVDQYRKAVSELAPKDVKTYLDATAKYGMALPAAAPKYGIVGFCWGGGMSFLHATQTPSLGAAVVYYGPSPASELITDSLKAPVLGLYAGNDARVNTTIPPADSTMRAKRKTFEHFIYEGSGHGFLRQQSGANGANFDATKQAWPATIAWFRRYLEG
jgi:carboxymethylenebutenolidase